MTKRPRTILIVEDEPIISMDMADTFTAAGWVIMGPAATLAQAEKALQDGLPDDAVLDLNLKRETTVELATRLHQASVRMVLLTGEATSELPEVLNTIRVIPKPVPMQDVVAAFQADGVM